MKPTLKLRTFRHGDPPKRGEGLRIGTTRRPPGGATKKHWSDYFDVWFLVLALSPLLFAHSQGAAPDAARTVTSLSGPGWKLWRDTEAKWKDDVLFAPPVTLPPCR